MGNDGENFTNDEDNSYHVVTAKLVTETAVLDGFTITGGNADGDGSFQFGGGLVCEGENFEISNPTLSNCRFEKNQSRLAGGAVYCGGSAAPNFSNCIFVENGSSSGGGGVYSDQSTPAFSNCSFEQNEASGFGGALYVRGRVSSLLNCYFVGNRAQLGGAVYVEQAIKISTNCVFQANAADLGGGAVVLQQSDSVFINCTLSGNGAKDGGAIFASLNSDPVLKNSIIWNNVAGEETDSVSASINIASDSNPTFEYCVVANSGGSSSWSSEFGIDGGSNLDVDPLFVASIDLINGPTTEGDLRLREGSPAIDRGNNSAGYLIDGAVVQIDSVLFDIAGKARIQSAIPSEVPIVDLGAYEWVAAVTFADWIDQFFSNEDDSSIVGLDADPDRDAIINIHEFGFGLRPNTPDGFLNIQDGEIKSLGLPRIFRIGDGDNFVFTRRLAFDGSDIKYLVERSFEMKTWVEIGNVPERILSDNTVELVKLAVESDPGDHFQKSFYRVSVELD